MTKKLQTSVKADTLNLANTVLSLGQMNSYEKTSQYTAELELMKGIWTSLKFIYDSANDSLCIRYTLKSADYWFSVDNWLSLDII